MIIKFGKCLKNNSVANDDSGKQQYISYYVLDIHK